MLKNCPNQKLITRLKIQPTQNHSETFNLRIPSIPTGNLAIPYRRYLKSSSPQRPMPDNETKGGIFSGEGDNC